MVFLAIFDASKCGCPQDCYSVHYKHNLAQVKVSAGYTAVVEQVYNFSIG